MKNNLPDRISILKNTPLYKGGELLIDVGCATGYFEVMLAKKYKKIIAFAPHKEEIKKAKKITSHLNNVAVSYNTFGSYDFKNIKADMVFFGNCIHYVFIEFNGFGFIPKLLSITKKYLIIEYPYDINLNKSDMIVLKNNLISKGLDKLFTKANILKQLKPNFILEQTLKSGSKTREIIVLRRKNES